MGDRKRPLEGGSVGPPKKMVSDYYASQFAEAAVNPPLFTLEKQNKAMALRLQEQRTEVSRLEQSSRTLQQALEVGQARLTTLYGYLQQLENDTLHVLARIDAPAASGFVQGQKVAIPPLLRLLTEAVDNEDDTRGHLSDHRQMVLRIITKVVEVVHREQESRNSALAVLRAPEKEPSVRCAEAQSLLEGSAAAASSYESKAVDLAHAQARTASQRADLASAEAARVTAKLAQLDTQLNDAKEERDAAVRQATKLTKIVEDLEQRLALLPSSAPMETTDSPSVGSTGVATPSVPMNPPPLTSQPSTLSLGVRSAVADGAAVGTDIIIDLQEQVRRQQAEVQRLCGDVARLTTELDQARTALVAVPDDRVISSRPYATVCTRLALREQELTAVIDDLTTKLLDARSTAETATRTLESERGAAVQKERTLEARLTELARTCAQITTARDDLKSKLEREMELRPRQGSLSEMSALLERLQGDLAHAQKQPRGVVSQSAPSEAAAAAATDSTTAQASVADSAATAATTGAATATATGPAEYGALEAKLKQAQTALAELQSKHCELLEREKDSKWLIEMFQTAARDRRDVVEVRLSERKLQERVSELEALVSECTSKHGAAHDPSSVLESKIAQLTAANEAQKSETLLLLEELETVSKHYEEARDRNVRLAKQMTEQDDHAAVLGSERVKLSQRCTALQDESRALREHIISLKDRIAGLTDQLTLSEARLRSSQELVAKSNQEASAAVALVDALRRQGYEATQQATSLHAQLEELDPRYKREIQEKTAIRAELLKAQSDLEQAKAELVRANQKTDRIRTGGPDDSVRLDNEILRRERRCPVCSTRKKTHVIGRCFHIFCEKCVMACVEARNRQCPTCHARFDKSEIHQVYGLWEE